MSSAGIADKNKLNSNEVWALLLKFDLDGYGSLRIAQNNEDITWNGETWLAYPAFTMDDIEETTDGEIPQLSLTIHDISRRIIPIIDDLDGGVGGILTIYIVHGTSSIMTSEAEFEHELEIVGASIHGSHVIKLRLGGENLYNYRVPQDRFLRSCRYKPFPDDPRCGYVGAETVCNRTLTRCKELGNQSRFGGFPGIGREGIMR